jgi:hypothetical protein
MDGIAFAHTHTQCTAKLSSVVFASDRLSEKVSYSAGPLLAVTVGQTYSCKDHLFSPIACGLFSSFS